MMFDELEDLDEEVFGSQGAPGPKPTHCNVPLTRGNARAALGRPSYGQKVTWSHPCRREWSEICKLAGEGTITSLDFSRIQHDILNAFHYELTPEQEVSWQQQLRIGNLLDTANLSSLSGVMALTPETAHEPNPSERAHLKKSYSTRTFLENGVMMSGSPSQGPLGIWEKTRTGVSFAKTEQMSIYVTENLCLIETQNSRCLGSRDHLLILSDLAAQRYIIRLLMILEAESPERPLPSLTTLDKILINGDLMLKRAGDAGYSVIKTFEAETQCHLVGDIPVGETSGQTYKEVTYKSSEDAAGRCGCTELLFERRQLVDSIARTPRHLTELFGLYRIWGHPTVDPLAGASALKKIATQVRGIHMEEAEKVTLKFKEEFIMRYIAKEHRWPQLDVSQLSPSNIIRRSYEEGGIFPRAHPSYRRQHLELVDFAQTFEVDPKFDLIEMIADKAMSLMTDELLSKLRRGQGTGSSTERSVLINWLKSPHHDPKTFLMSIDLFGFQENERSVGVKEKERELKIEARLFGMMTFFKRMYIVLTEALLAEHILPYFPEITMVDDEISLDKKRLNFNSKRYKGRSLFTSLDFQKWNSYMREFETRGLFRCLDQLFGFINVYQRTHEMFDSSFIYLLNSSYMPTAEANGLKTDIGVDRHLGGIEGLRQKGWTLWTVTLILLAAEELSITLNLMGQGDNQVLREIFPEHFSRKRILKEHFRLIGRLHSILKKIGPPLKVEETWTSEKLFVYGKYTIYDGAALPMTLKRAIRIFRLSNEDFPTIESTLSSQTANLSAAVSSRDSVGHLYYVYAAEAVGALQLYLTTSYLQPIAPFTIYAKGSYYSPAGTERPRSRFVPPLLPSIGTIPDWILTSIMLLPRSFGGFPVATVYHTLIRGFPDDVSFALASLRLIYPHLPHPVQKVVESFLNPPLAETKNFSLLFEQPTALNIASPPAPGESRRNIVINFLRTTPIIKNPYFQTFIGLLGSDEEARIAQYLESAEPFNPRVLGMIAASTTVARARHIAGKLQKTVTISKIAREAGGCNIFSAVQSSELRQLSYVLQIVTRQLKGNTPWTPNTCSVSHAAELRKKGWGKDVVGVDCVPPQEFMFLELDTSLSQCSPKFDLGKGHIVVRHQRTLSPDQWADPLIVGDHSPYRGSITRQKVRGFGDKIATQAEPLLQKALRTATLIGWGVKKDGNLDLLIRLLIASKTDLPVNLLIPEDENLTGSLHHRLQDDRSDHGGAVSVLPNYGSRFSFDTFPLTAYSKGSSNVNLMFQSIMSLGTALLGHAISRGWYPSFPVSHIHVKSACCVREIDDTLIETPSLPDFPISSYPDNPFLFTPKEKVLGDSQIRSCLTPHGNLSDNLEIRAAQFESLVADEIVTILKPLTWGTQSLDNRTHKIPINWTLKVSVIRVLERVALRLCLIFSGSSSYQSFVDLIIAVASRVDQSDVDSWSQLDNLIFAPNIHHELVSKPYGASISGNPCLTPRILGVNLRSTVVRILQTWGESPSVMTDRFRGLFSSSVRAPAQCHPGIQRYLVEWGENRAILNRTKLRDLIHYVVGDVHKLSAPLSNRDIEICNHQGNFVLKENPDLICKGVVYHSEVEGMERQEPPVIPSATLSLFTFYQNSLRDSVLEFNPLMVRHSKDYEAFRYKPVSKPTSGSFKGLSLLETLQFVPKRLLCLGDGSGGYTLSAGLLFPKAEICYNSLITSTAGIQQAPPIPYIPALAGHPEIEKRVEGLSLLNELVSDFTHDQFVPALQISTDMNFDVVISDAESPDFVSTISGITLVVGIAKILVASRPEVAIVKTYLVNPTAIMIQVSVMLSLYKEVSILRSEFSTSGNTEVFLKGIGFHAQTPPTWDGSKLVGLVLGYGQLRLMDGLLQDLLSSHTIPTPSQVVAYSLVIEPDLANYLSKQATGFFPMLLVHSELVYPHSVLEVIRRTTVTRVESGPTPMGTLKIPHVSHSMMRTWAMAWLCLMEMANGRGEGKVNSIWRTGFAIWYPLRSGEWEMSLVDCHPPDWRALRPIRYWKLSRLLSTGDMKVVHRMIGVFSMIRKTVHSLSSDETRGGWTKHGGPLSTFTQSPIPWVAQTAQQQNIEKPNPFPASLNPDKLHKTWSIRRSSYRG
ncbi:RNA-dependent RNA polymerase [Hubei rhabdo-like virus 1]|uniref:RNA-dependent RNA polymerase n=1 Tax=Hubei rhabdo-like virus 1 TaxID=1923185 RepID=UPI00090C87D8|nr:RNA-dependent RNA polymerase [Hubei rhabdo-like virus 1]APG78710.1 RNA-dependent RNA polymerase [Hubei rhabdo-like virus 1]